MITEGQLNHSYCYMVILWILICRVNKYLFHRCLQTFLFNFLHILYNKKSAVLALTFDSHGFHFLVQFDSPDRKKNCLLELEMFVASSIYLLPVVLQCKLITFLRKSVQEHIWRCNKLGIGFKKETSKCRPWYVSKLNKKSVQSCKLMKILIFLDKENLYLQ